MKLLPAEEQIYNIILDPIQKLGYEIVRIKFLEGGKRKTLQIMIERIDNKDITVDDCEKVSYTISAILDVEDPIAGEYNLEISSPGIDRPLTRLKDFKNYISFETKLTTEHDIAGRKRFKGKIIEVKENNIKIYLADTKEEVGINFDEIKAAKLVLTEELIKATKKN